MAATTVNARFLKPPVVARSAPPAIMPTANTISANAASPVLPPKWSSTMMGNNADIGAKTSVNAKPHHRSANRPRKPLSTLNPSSTSTRIARTVARIPEKAPQERFAPSEAFAANSPGARPESDARASQAFSAECRESSASVSPGISASSKSSRAAIMAHTAMSAPATSNAIMAVRPQSG